jgi:hypothetical protein
MLKRFMVAAIVWCADSCSSRPPLRDEAAHRNGIMPPGVWNGDADAILDRLVHNAHRIELS